MNADRIKTLLALADRPPLRLPAESELTLDYIGRQFSDAVAERRAQSGDTLPAAERFLFLNLAFISVTYQTAALVRAEVAGASIGRLCLEYGHN
jgi:hypothetical protein